MPKLSRIRPRFSELSAEDRLNLILAIRLNRRTSKRPPPAERTPREKAAAKTPRTVSQLSDSQLARLEAELLALLEE